VPLLLYFYVKNETTEKNEHHNPIFSFFIWNLHTSRNNLVKTMHGPIFSTKWRNFSNNIFFKKDHLSNIFQCKPKYNMWSSMYCRKMMNANNHIILFVRWSSNTYRLSYKCYLVSHIHLYVVNSLGDSNIHFIVSKS